MHTLERYALSCGVKIDKPHIFEEFYPLNFEKYITIDSSAEIDTKKYDYYNEVVDLIKEYLDENKIKILQIGNQNDARITSAHTSFDANASQKAYILKGSLFHIGNNEYTSTLASHFKIKNIFLNSISYSQNVKPYWNDCLIIEPERSAKPSFGTQEPVKQINKIKPEQIAQAAFDALGLSNATNVNTFKIGSDYLSKNVSVIPNCVFNANLPFVISRLDKEYNQEVLIEQLKISKAHIITSKPIHPDILNQFKQNILSVTYMIEKENQPNFVQFLKRLGIAYNLISELEDQDFEDLKLDYIDYGIISQINKPKREDFDFSSIKSLKYVSSKNFISNDKIYPSLAAVEADKPIEKIFDTTPQDVIDNPEFWRQSESFYFLTNA
jgi:hypothetical protein